MALPALRPIDVSPIQHEGQLMICLQDPEGYVETPILLSPAAFMIASLLNGTNDVLDIQYQICSRTGNIVASEDIRRIVSYLDEHGFLFSEQFEQISHRIREEFHRQEIRKAYLAGKSYPQEVDKLRDFLNDCFTREKGPGKIPSEFNQSSPNQTIKAIIAPHIDFERGGHVYGHAYLKLAQANKPSVLFIFGVAHAPVTTPFVLTRKHFETPLGTLKTNGELVDTLAQACGWEPFQDEIVHRTEHSIEFQAVMLAHVWGTEFTIVPILCGALPNRRIDKELQNANQVDTFLKKCNEIVKQLDREVCVVSGADLAHVGKRFGDPFDIDDAVLSKIRARDEEDLGFVFRVDPEGWYASVMKDENERKVCGISSIYALLRSIQGWVTAGQLLEYDYAPDPIGGVVSFAGVAFT